MWINRCDSEPAVMIGNKAKSEILPTYSSPYHQCPSVDPKNGSRFFCKKQSELGGYGFLSALSGHEEKDIGSLGERDMSTPCSAAGFRITTGKTLGWSARSSVEDGEERMGRLGLGLGRGGAFLPPSPNLCCVTVRPTAWSEDRKKWLAALS